MSAVPVQFYGLPEVVKPQVEQKVSWKINHIPYFFLSMFRVAVIAEDNDDQVQMNFTLSEDVRGRLTSLFGLMSL